MKKPSIQVRMAGDADAAALAAFYREAWNAEGTAATVAASRQSAALANVAEPGAAWPTAIAVFGERVIGYVSSIPMRIYSAGREWPAYWAKGLMVIPEYRNGPIGYLVMKELVASIPRSGVLLVAPAARRLLEALGYRDLGVVPNYLRVLRGGRVAARLDAGLIERVPRWAANGLATLQRSGLARPLGAAGAIGLSTYAWTRSRGLGRYRLDHGPIDPHAVDQLWRRARAAFGAASVRDGKTVSFRYGLAAGNGGANTAVAVWDHENLTGLAVVRRPSGKGDPRLRGIRVATVSDLLFTLDEPLAGLAVLRCAEQAARRFDADALLCSSPNPVVASLLRRQAYAHVGGNLHFFWREASEVHAEVPERLDQWWITRGDAESDGVF